MAFMLSFSLLAPAIFTLTTDQIAINLTQNTAEEENENQGNNLLEEIKEKKLLLSDFLVGDPFQFDLERKDSFYYSASTLDLAKAIFLPPPEQA